MCFSIQWWETLFIFLIVIGAAVAIIRLFIPWIVEWTGYPILGQALNIILKAIIAIMIVIIVFGLLSCLFSIGGGLKLPSLR